MNKLIAETDKLKGYLPNGVKRKEVVKLAILWPTVRDYAAATSSG